MAASHLAILNCDLTIDAGCLRTYPKAPAAYLVGTLRSEAAQRGWEVMRGKHGRDACPRCRIVEIARAQGTADPEQPDGGDV